MGNQNQNSAPAPAPTPPPSQSQSRDDAVTVRESENEVKVKFENANSNSSKLHHHHHGGLEGLAEKDSDDITAMIDRDSCATSYMHLLEECLGENERKWSLCQKEVKLLKLCNEARASADDEDSKK